MNWARTEPVRLWLYGLMAPVMAILVGYGVLSDAQASMWITLATAALGIIGGTEFARSKAYAPAHVAATKTADSPDHPLSGTGSVG